MPDQLSFDLSDEDDVGTGADAPLPAQPSETSEKTLAADAAVTLSPPPVAIGLVVRVVADTTGMAKRFDYVVPEAWAEQIGIGTRVRIALGPRRIGAWITDVGVEPTPGVTLRPISKITGHGPTADLVDLAAWARWRWGAKSEIPFLRAASPARAHAGLPSAGRRSGPVSTVLDPDVSAAFAKAATAPGPIVLRRPPAADLSPVVAAAAALGDALVICPSRAQAAMLAATLRRTGVPVAVLPDQWDLARAGGHVVIGARVAAWASVPALAAVVVVDEHDEMLQEESSPTWHARDVAVERARRAGVPCVLVSPSPSLEALAIATEVVAPSRNIERAGWPVVDIVDRRDEDVARQALFSPRFADLVRSGARVIAVLNQKGRSVLLACGKCRSLARCAHCDGAMQRLDKDSDLVCRSCAQHRPVVCRECGSVQLKAARMGVSRVRDDLEALAGAPVTEVSADTPVQAIDGARLIVGTEAVLHQARHADVIAFLDFDQELLAVRYRAADQAMALLVRAGRIVGGRSGAGRVLVQTRIPDHEVLRSALLGDPDRLARHEYEQRAIFGYPPHGVVAEIGDQAAEVFASRLDALGIPDLEVLGPVDNKWRVQAPDHKVLCDALAAVDRPGGRLRLAVDPPRI